MTIFLQWQLSPVCAYAVCVLTKSAFPSLIRKDRLWVQLNTWKFRGDQSPLTSSRELLFPHKKRFRLAKSKNQVFPKECNSGSPSVLKVALRPDWCQGWRSVIKCLIMEEQRPTCVAASWSDPLVQSQGSQYRRAMRNSAWVALVTSVCVVTWLIIVLLLW